MHYQRDILGVKVDFGMSYDDVLYSIESCLNGATFGNYVCTTNPEFIVDAQKDIEFKKIINNSLLSVPDGVGVLYANLYISQLPERTHSALINIAGRLKTGIRTAISSNPELSNTITGVELTNRLARLSAEKGFSLFLLGGRYPNGSGDVAVDASEILKKRYPGINIVGATSSYSRDSYDDKNTVEFIKQKMKEKHVTHIDIILIAYNHPFQEKWLVRNASKIPAKFAMGVGGTFNMLVGSQPSENTFFKDVHLWWLYRLITQPHRITRTVKAFPVFPYLVFSDSLAH